MPTSESVGRLVLDTHVWIWLMEGSPKLKPAVRRRIEEGSQNGLLQISAISVWEVAMLETKGRITLMEECNIWIRNSLSAPGISLVPVSPDIAVDSTRLPGVFHGDPADRIIIATARACGGLLVTADKAIQRFARQGHVHVLPVS
jgi:PIN domain nuclease of toxin-antitoxin system